jgi:hypothetical protein
MVSIGLDRTSERTVRQSGTDDDDSKDQSDVAPGAIKPRTDKERLLRRIDGLSRLKSQENRVPRVVAARLQTAAAEVYQMGQIDDAAKNMKDATDRNAKAEKHAIDRAADQEKEETKNAGEDLKAAGKEMKKEGERIKDEA